MCGLPSFLFKFGYITLSRWMWQRPIVIYAIFVFIPRQCAVARQCAVDIEILSVCPSVTFRYSMETD